MGAAKPAFEIPAGSLVSFDGAVFLKAEREAKEHIGHYLVPLTAENREGLTLLYIDPEEPLIPESGVKLVLSEETRPGPARVGDILAAARGKLLKLFDAAKSQRHFCYVDIVTGQVLRRQERDDWPLVADWRVE